MSAAAALKERTKGEVDGYWLDLDADLDDVFPVLDEPLTTSGSMVASATFDEATSADFDCGVAFDALAGSGRTSSGLKSPKVGDKFRLLIENAVEQSALDVAEADALLFAFRPAGHLGFISIENRVSFELLADELEDYAAARSSMGRVRRHPAFVELIELPDRELLALVFARLRRGHRPLWLGVLAAVADVDPALGSQSLDEAAERWLEWGRSSGLVAA
jgi:hypothetical protein